MFSMLYEKDLLIIDTLQTRFYDYSYLFLAISKLFDPKYAFHLYIPVVFSIDWRTGRQLMWTVVITEWTNHILKWVICADRPYWWVHEATFINNASLVELRQFPLTCETGPGCPSGHSQITAAMWYLIFDSLLLKTHQNTKFMSYIGWSVYYLMLFLVGCSRVFIAAHFPHQCLLGFILGIATAVKIKNINLSPFTALHCCTISAVMLAFGYSTYHTLKFLELNPDASLEKATRWCSDPLNINPANTPFSAMMRYSGFTLGMGLGFSCKTFKCLEDVNYTLKMKLTTMFLSFSAGLLTSCVTVPTDSEVLFYVLSFLQYAVLAYTFCCFVPSIVMRVFSTKLKD